MKSYLVFACESCGFTSRNKEEVELCEAKHIGLSSLEELRHYKKLKERAIQCGYVVSVSNNEQTRREYDAAIDELLIFEKAHGIG